MTNTKIMDKILPPIKQRVIDFIADQNIKKVEFFNATDISASNFKGKGMESELGGDKIAKILTFYDNLNPEWLLTGRGEKIKNEIPISPAYKNNGGVPLVAMEAAAGFGSNDFTIRDEDIQGRYLVPDFNGIDFMIRVKGSSMYPKYSSGDVIACRILHNSKFIQWNKCYVVATREQGLLIKRLKKAPTENTLLAISDNKEYDPFEIPTNEITGMALVIGVIRLE